MSGGLELTIERLIAAPVSVVWTAYNEHLEEWFCPRPWRAEIVIRDLRPGGRALINMHGPDGELVPNDGVFLEVEPERRIVFTDAFLEGWKPAGPFMVGMFEFEPQGGKTLFRGTARHWTQDAYDSHTAMGFHEGWGRMAEQLEEVALRIA